MIHIYYGTGKGKTTAAFGAVLRFLASVQDNNTKVCITQFMKNKISGEAKILQGFSCVTLLYGKACNCFYKDMTQKQKQDALLFHTQNLLKTKALLQKQEYRLCVLDEFCFCYEKGLIDRGLAKDFVLKFPKQKELILTGRTPPNFVLEVADYATQMICQKHPLQKGTKARAGIEY